MQRQRNYIHFVLTHSCGAPWSAHCETVDLNWCAESARFLCVVHCSVPRGFTPAAMGIKASASGPRSTPRHQDNSWSSTQAGHSKSSRSTPLYLSLLILLPNRITGTLAKSVMVKCLSRLRRSATTTVWCAFDVWILVTCELWHRYNSAYIFVWSGNSSSPLDGDYQLVIAHGCLSLAPKPPTLQGNLFFIFNDSLLRTVSNILCKNAGLAQKPEDVFKEKRLTILACCSEPRTPTLLSNCCDSVTQMKRYWLQLPRPVYPHTALTCMPYPKVGAFQHMSADYFYGSLKEIL